MNLQQLFSAQERYPSLSGVDFYGLNSFLRMARLARPLIEFQQKDRRRLPDFLYHGLLELLAVSISETNLSLVQTCRAAFKEIIWTHPEVVPTENEVIKYNNAALCRGISFGHLLPPVRVCQDPSCSKHRPCKIS
ncbi:hypothetical protein C8J57DRAFT_1068512 [Mycena rebaudengoi]|nr:hypothetical protein C8J57DRAFT_1068512 [Mycena rebaudengoi]